MLFDSPHKNLTFTEMWDPKCLQKHPLEVPHGRLATITGLTQGSYKPILKRKTTKHKNGSTISSPTFADTRDNNTWQHVNGSHISCPRSLTILASSWSTTTIWIWRWKHRYIHICIYVYIYIYIYLYIYLYIYIYMHIYIHMFIYACILLDMHTYM